MKKRMMALFLGAVLLTMTACGSSAPAASSEAPAAEASAEEASTEASSEETFQVGICQLVQHDALDAASQGFQDALKEEFGDAVQIDLQNAQGEASTCATIVNGFVSNEYDIIMANATPALQAAVAATTDIPILGTSITDYATALNLENFSGTTGINVSGTSDLAPLDKQEDMILELVPDVQKVAILYCSAEANSKFQADTIEGYLEEDGIAFEEYTFADSNDLQSVVNAAVADCDAMYIPTDNTVASNMTIVANVTGPAGIPVICGEENMMLGGGLATLSISYYDIGFETGKQAIEILKNGAEVSELPIAYAAEPVKKINKANAEEIGFEIPEDYEVVEP
ncbi:MAG: ABC transporter substrate-binding protein [Lachnospiraceae bacterium]|nr:ABC transporter substrate-binding protein [Lachnospiraceae bacterium]